MKREIYMDYAEILENARKLIYEKCKVCADCNGVVCRGQVSAQEAKVPADDRTAKK